MVVKYNKIQFYVFTRLIVFCIFNSSKQHSDEVNVKLLANIDEGVAIDLEKVACLLREKDTKKHWLFWFLAVALS